MDKTYKRMFIVKYSTEDEVYAETLFSQFKKAGKIKEFWGEHATYHFARLKEEEKVANTSKLRWHRICDAHSCTILLTGIVMLEDIKDPNRKVNVEYWKPSKAER